MAILTNEGRIAVTAAVKAQPIHLAWGSGDPLWDTNGTPSDNLAATQLIAEFGRRKASQVSYCLPSATGEISLPAGRFTISADPTNYLYLRFSFAATDAPTQVIRETGIFLGTIAKSTISADQLYLAPDQVQDFGKILTIENTGRIARSSAIQQQFEFVVEF